MIKWVSLLITFKFYRMTYTHFMGSKNFLVLYQKKKFKKHTVVLTLLSQFLCELPVIISGLVSLGTLPWGEQLIISQLDTLAIAGFLITLEFIEIATLDKIMKTTNTKGHKARKSAAAVESSDEGEINCSSTDSDGDDDYPDWRGTIKTVNGNENLYKQTKCQLKINGLEKKFNLRCSASCGEFDTGYDKEEDDRLVRSFPTSPREYKDFDGIDFNLFGKNFDNVYAESRAPGGRGGKEFSEMGSQAQPSDILTALARKGGDLMTPGLDKDDYSKRKSQKKKRGRKNKYIAAIDAEDDEEADQMSDGSDDGLDGIKEEDDEDEEERLAKMAKLKELED